MRFHLRSARVLFSALLLLALVFLFSYFSPPARAAIGIIVNTTADNTTGGDGFCTLREAITNANSNGDTTGGDCSPGIVGADTITFSVSGTITLGSSLPGISDDVTIDGTGQSITVSGNNAVRPLGVLSGKTLSLKFLTIANGYCSAGCAGGAGIINGGTLNIANSTLSGNSAAVGAGSGGGGIFNNGGTVNIANSTLSGNSVTSAGNRGGGIFNNTGGTVNIANSTLYGNSATDIGGGFVNFGTVNLKNNILSGNTAATGGDCYNNSGATISGSNNLVDNTSCSGGGSGSLGRIAAVTNFDTTLADNGGPTETHKLNGGSNALEAVPAGQCTYVSSGTNPLFTNGATIATDQRGVIRPQNTTCDVGSYELLFCAAGSYDNGSASCAPAPAGYYVSAPGAVAPSACLPGTWQDQSGQSSCNLADPGFFVPSSASTVQTACPAGSNSAAAAVACYQTGPSFVVNDASDTDDTACDALPGDCTLREAINAANAHPNGVNPDTITFDILDTGPDCASDNVCTITLSALNTLPAIDDDVTIDGAPNNGNITISGAYLYRVMMVNSGKTLGLNALTIANGYIFSGFAGGIWNYGTLNVTNSTFNTNYASSGGGGILNEGGTVNIADSTFNGNNGGSGGAIYNLGGTYNIANSTFSGNYANNGGVLFNFDTTANITNSTFSGNYANNGGVVYNLSGTLNLKNNILTNATTGGDCANSATITGSSNLIDDTTCGSSSSFRLGAVTGFDTTLANNGGPTQTFKLNSNSNAINAVPAGQCAYVSSGTNPLFSNGAAITTDQRGETRPQGLFCDVGAYEFVYTGFQTGPNFLVNSAADTNDNSCDTLGQGIGNKDCTLREAINAANAHPNGINPDTITFEIPDDVGALCSADNTCTITLGAMLPNINDDVTIDGAPNSGHITVSGNNAVTVMQVNNGKTLSVNALSIVNGKALGNGGGIFNGTGTLNVTNSTLSGNSAAFNGGAILNNGGTVNVTNTTFSGNSTTTAGSGYGGGIYNYSGTLNVTNSTFSGNSATNSGGAIYNEGTSLTVTNSTFSGNSATGAGGGGGIYNAGTLTVLNGTLSGNSATNNGGGIRNAGTLILVNTIIAGSTNGGDCVGSIDVATHNLIQNSGSACGVTNGTNGNLVGVDPNLAPLADNGGPTQTMALANFSAAIDAGKDDVCADNVQPTSVNSLDQRGEPRNDLQCDIGAFELRYGTSAPNSNSVTVLFGSNGEAHSFGPALAIINGTSVTPPTNFTVTINPTAYIVPAPPPNAVPIQWNATADNTPFSILVTLCYLPGVSPTGLHVYHHNGSTWDDLGGTVDTVTHAPYACVSATTPLTSLSPLALAPFAPTATNVTGVKGFVNQNGKIALRWKTTSETQIAGFNIYRQAKQGVWKKVNTKFRQAKHAGSALGDTYRFIDRKANPIKPQRYKIEIVYLDGHTEWTKVVKVKMP